MPSRAELFLAYRQAKSTLFFEHRGVGLLDLAKFESDLDNRLSTLANQLSENGGWFDDLPLGHVWIVPKRIRPGRNETGVARTGVHDPHLDRPDLDVQVRYSPSVESAIVETLFLWRFGPGLEAILSPSVLGHRLDVRKGRLNPTRRWLFEYWPARYQQFRDIPINKAKSELEADRSVLVLSADMKSFYDTVDPSFLLSNTFMEELARPSAKRDAEPLDLDAYGGAVSSLLRFYSSFRAVAARRTGLEWEIGIPIGALTSRLVGNLALSTLDQAIERLESTICYRRYVDDIVLVARSDGNGVGDLAESIESHIPHTSQEDGDIRLDSEGLGRRGSDFRIQKEKCRAHLLGGVAGQDFLDAIGRDFSRLVSEQRAFIDISVLLADPTSHLVHAGAPGRPLTVLREADKAKLERFGVSTVLRSLERASVLVDQESARALAKRTLDEMNRFLTGDGDWVDHLALVFRLLRLGVRTGDWDESERLIDDMNSKWGSVEDLKETIGRLFHRERQIVGEPAWVWLRNYLHARRVEAICTAIRTPRRGSDLPEWLRDGVVEGTDRRSWRALVRRARLLAAADLRALDREDDSFGENVEEQRFDETPVYVGDPDLADRFSLASRFIDLCESLEDRPWRVAPARLFLCTRPPSYFDIARRFLFRTESTGFDFAVFADLLSLVNAIRGTDYQDPVGAVIDEHTVAVPSPTQRRLDPRLILGNLVASEKMFQQAARRNPLLSVERLRALALVLSRAARIAGAGAKRANLLVLPELCLPREWFREVANYVARHAYYGLIAGLEYRHTRNGVWNQVYAVIPGPFSSAAAWPWTKRYPAREEAAELKKLDVSFITASKPDRRRTVVESQYGRLSALICSEMLEAERVADLLGRVELVLAPSWNRDTASYDHLIQSVGLQLHSIVAVANNGHYSDCRAWAPHRERWKRDLCRLIERDLDDTVSVVLPLASLENWHRDPARDQPGDSAEWRPLPPGWPTGSMIRVTPRFEGSDG